MLPRSTVAPLVRGDQVKPKRGSNAVWSLTRFCILNSGYPGSGSAFFSLMSSWKVHPLRMLRNVTCGSPKNLTGIAGRRASKSSRLLNV